MNADIYDELNQYEATKRNGVCRSSLRLNTETNRSLLNKS